MDSRVVSGAPPRVTGEGSRSPYRQEAAPINEEERFEEEDEPFDEYANSIYSDEEL